MEDVAIVFFVKMVATVENFKNSNHRTPEKAFWRAPLKPFCDEKSHAEPSLLQVIDSSFNRSTSSNMVLLIKISQLFLISFPYPWLLEVGHNGKN